jgi:CRP-like cAMP-binding protein
MRSGICLVFAGVAPGWPGFDNKLHVQQNGRKLSFNMDMFFLIERICRPPVPAVRNLVDESSIHIPREHTLRELSELVKSGLVSVRQRKASDGKSHHLPGID